MNDFPSPAEDGWFLVDSGAVGKAAAGMDARFTLANGRLGVRGVPGLCGGRPRQPDARTYIAGLFVSGTGQGGAPALVPAPVWPAITVTIDGRPLLQGVEAHGPLRLLDMRRGLVLTDWRAEASDDALLLARTCQHVSLVERGLYLHAVRLDFQGEAACVLSLVCSGLASPLTLESATADLCVWKAPASEEVLACAARATVRVDGRDAAPTDELGDASWRWHSRPGQIVEFDLIAAFSRGGEPPGAAAGQALVRAGRRGSGALAIEHRAAWDERWQCSEVVVEGDPSAQRALRFAAYHLNGAANPNDEHVSIGARGLTGDDYLGHVFWDTEIFLLPFYTLTWPQAARALLMYRYHGLGGAREKAIRLGWRGAFYAWESADDGDETAPEHAIDPHGDRVDVLSGLEEEHISADVAYAVWQYWRATGDDAFLRDAGAEMLAETARFWASRATLEADGRRHIRDVEGPDEYHERIDDNAFTNMMARWNLRTAIDVVGWMRQTGPQRWSALANRLDLSDAELEAWTEVADTLVTGFDPPTGLYEQFAGYFGLKPVDLRQYADRKTPMDVVLGRARTRASQVIKQADVVALQALQPEAFDQASGLANFRYYEPRCDHSSSLSAAMHALVAARLGESDAALDLFRKATAVDLGDDLAHSAGGIHLATLGGLWQAAVLGFGGLSFDDQGLVFEPRPPTAWTRLEFVFQWRGRRVRVCITPGAFQATLEAGDPLKVVVYGRRYDLSRQTPLSA